MKKLKHQIWSDQSLSRVRLFVTPWIAARQTSLSIINSRSSLRLTSIELVMPSSHIILSSPSPPSPNPSQHQGLFQWINSSHEVAKVLVFQLQHHSFQRNPRADLLQNGLKDIILNYLSVDCQQQDLNSSTMGTSVSMKFNIWGKNNYSSSTHIKGILVDDAGWLNKKVYWKYIVGHNNGWEHSGKYCSISVDKHSKLLQKWQWEQPHEFICCH